MRRTARLKEVLWRGYVWPKGRVGNAVQGKLLESVEVPRTRRALRGAQQVVVVHTPGKVGSKALVAAVKNVSFRPNTAVFHTHRINPRSRQAVLEEWTRDAPRRTQYTAGELGRWLDVQSDPWVLVLSAVRDPMERNLSAFFQATEHYTKDGRPVSSGAVDRATELAATFVEDFPHFWQDVWFEQELNDVFGVDVLGTDFNHTQGFQVTTRGRCRVGVVRHDAMRRGAAQQMLTEVLECDVPNVPEVNVSAGKSYDTVLRRVREEVRMPSDVIRRMYEGPVAQHFYTPEERSVMIERWVT